MPDLSRKKRKNKTGRPKGTLRKAVKKICFGNMLYSFTLSGRVPEQLACVPSDAWPGNAVRGKQLINGAMDFAQHSVRITPSMWQAPGAPEDWFIAAHGFEWLRDLRAVGGDTARRRARNLITNWLNAHPVWDETAWRADITGIRLANWVGVHDFYCATAEDAFRLRLFDAIQKQSRHLQRVLPGDLKGSALIGAIKGLIFAGSVLPHADGRIIKGVRLLLRELPNQILPDGGHIERNPSEHLAVLRHLIDIRTAITAARKPFPERLQTVIEQMGTMLRLYRHADNGLALFNGGREGDAVFTDMVLNQSGARSHIMYCAPQTGYERLQLGRCCVIVDAGNPPPRGYDKHAHAGLFSFEMSVGKDRIIVNCGHAGTTENKQSLAGLLRSTAAHSTLVIDDRTCIPIAEDGGLETKKAALSVQRQYGNEVLNLEMSHNFYQPAAGITHKRRIQMRDMGETLEGQDILMGDTVHDFAIRFHLHPNVTVSRIQNGKACLLRTKTGVGWKFIARGVEEIEIEESLYQPSPDEHPRRTEQIVLYGKTEERQTRVLWMLQREKSEKSSVKKSRKAVKETDEK